MAKSSFLPKRMLVDKANTRMVVIIAAASFITVFSIVAARALWGQQAYQSRVIAEKEKARNQLRINIAESEKLVEAYEAFVSTPTNLLGGSSGGAGERDGDNARLTLDALPSKYDFPALTASVEKLIADHNFQIESITGTDEEITHASAEPTPTPSPVEIPFEVSVSGNYGSIQNLVGVFQRSIRPFRISAMEFVGNDNQLTLKLTAKSYYQPERSLNIRTKVVK